MQKLIELFDCIWDIIEAAGGGTAKRPQESWRHIPGDPLTSDSLLDRFHVSKYFETSLKAAEQWGLDRVSILLQQAEDSLVWSQNESYSEAKFGHHFMHNYVFGLLTGPDALFAREAPPSGFLLLGPHTVYPAHHHEPREVYWVMTPGGEWRLDNSDWFSVSPGEVIHHAPGQSHAMRTQATPMLAFVAWLDHGNRSAIAV